MPNLITQTPLSEADYEAIASAVMETSRGRWFLAEFARRNRHADTTMLLGALERIESAVTRRRTEDEAASLRLGLADMAQAIARTKAEIAAIRPSANVKGRFAEVGEELDSVVQATEAATCEILACAEHIQELAWTMREQGLATDLCDAIDAKATEVYTACSFQDLTGQRTRKVIEVLRYLEERIAGMTGAFDPDEETPEPQEAGDNVLPLLGPAKPGEGLAQSDVDEMMAVAPMTDAPPPFLDATNCLIDVDDLPPPGPSLKLVSPAPARRKPPATAQDTDPLAPLNALSDEERLALFT